MPVLYYTILYHAILYYSILFYTIRYYHTILYNTIRYYTILYYTVLYYTILFHGRLWIEARAEANLRPLLWQILGLQAYVFHYIWPRVSPQATSQTRPGSPQTPLEDTKQEPDAHAFGKKH